MTMVEFSGNVPSKIWEKLQMLFMRMSLREFDKVWCVKGLNVTHNDLVVTWKVRPKWTSFIESLQVVVSLAIKFVSICAKKKKKRTNGPYPTLVLAA